MNRTAHNIRQEEAATTRYRLIVRWHDEHGLSFDAIAKLLLITRQRAHELYWKGKRLEGNDG